MKVHHISFTAEFILKYNTKIVTKPVLKINDSKIEKHERTYDHLHTMG